VGQVAGVVDAGTLGASASYPAEGWVQLAIDGGWGNYAVDAGIAYLDGGVAVLKTNALVGDFIQFVGGTGSGQVAPIVANDSRVINYVFQNVNDAKPNATSTFNLFANASHFYPWPVDGGYSSSYSQYGLVSAGNSSASATSSTPGGGTSSYSDEAPIYVSFVDLHDAPKANPSDNSGGTVYLNSAGAITVLSQVDINAAAANYKNDWLQVSGQGYLQGSYVSNGFVNVTVYPGATFFGVGDAITGSQAYGFQFEVLQGNAYIASSILAASDGTANQMIVDGPSNVVLESSWLNQGNATSADIATLYNTTIQFNGVLLTTDGGAGFVQCGSRGGISIFYSPGVTLPDAGFNFISLDNGSTWTTGTGYSTQDGGTAGVHQTCSQGSGCCYSNY